MTFDLFINRALAAVLVMLLCALALDVERHHGDEPGRTSADDQDPQ
jgi:hypothetical protein